MQREAERQRVRQARAAAQSQRAAAAARTRAAVQDQKIRGRMYVEDRTREAADDTAQVEHQVDVLQSVLALTLHVDDFLDLEALKQPPPYPVFDPTTVGAPPSPPRESDFAVEGPSVMGRVFAASKHAARAEQRQAEYKQALASYTAAAQQHSQRLEKARLKHGADVARLAEQHRQKVEEISALQRGLAARQPDAVVRYLDLVLEADRGGAVRTIVFNGYANGTNPATGREVRPCLVALATSRERFMEVDLARVDTVACL